jgi:phosphocarrier protein FPr/phosphocarrier protein
MNHVYPAPVSPSLAGGREAATGRVVLSDPVILPNPSGLHARPASALASLAKRFQSDIRLLRADSEANAKSIVGIIGLGAEHGDALRVKASGGDADQAVRALAALLAAGCNETDEEASPATVAAPQPVTAAANEIAGVPASPGLAIGRIFQFRRGTINVAEAGQGVEHEQARLYAALEAAWAQLEASKAGHADKARVQILAAHQELLTDPALIDGANEQVRAGKSAGFAWQQSYRHYAASLAALTNPLLRERSHDVEDVGRRVLAVLAGVSQEPIAVPPEAILVAEDLSPSDTTSLDRSRVRGFCTATGGATSHVAILARALNLPAICGIEAAALSLADDTVVILDGARGVLERNPDTARLAAARERIALAAERRAVEQGSAHAPALTQDGHRIEVVANIRNAADARDAVAGGGDGVGLLRSEFLFENRETAPSESEQADEYCAVARALGPERVLVVRTLDVGGDKPLPYMPLPKEDNPFLGLRGVRVSLADPAFFRTQLRAIAQAAPLSNLHVMFPMVASIEEFQAARRMLREVFPAGARVKVGVMIEVPSAALMAEQLAREADFFSIGTNDLTQYTLAMDRGHPRLARQADALHPAVLKMIEMTVAGAHRYGRWVGVCGGMASDPLAVPALVGLGVDELSVSVPAIAQVKAVVSRLSRAECAALAQELLLLGTADEVRARLLPFAEEGAAKA